MRICGGLEGELRDGEGGMGVMGERGRGEARGRRAERDLRRRG